MTGTLTILDKTGDTKLIWDSEHEVETEAARKQFDELTGKGYLAYRVDPKDSGKGTQMKKFDPHAEAIILAPRMVGG